MQLMEAFAAAFFRTFGITQPSDAARRGAAWFLLGMLLLVLVGLGVAGYVLLRVMYTGPTVCGEPGTTCPCAV